MTSLYKISLLGKFLSFQRKKLIKEPRSKRVKKNADRLRAILLLDAGKTYRDISEYLFLDEGTIANYKNRYEEGGLGNLLDDENYGKMCILSEKELEILSHDLEQKLYPNVDSILTYVKKKFGIEYSLTGMTDPLHRLGFSYKKPTGVPGKADLKKQEKFIKRYKRERSLGGMIFFCDSTHPEFNTSLQYVRTLSLR